jgi:hypothetical protein
VTVWLCPGLFQGNYAEFLIRAIMAKEGRNPGKKQGVITSGIKADERKKVEILGKESMGHQ